MALAIATPTITLVGQTTAQVATTAATGGTGPYTYQWYRSTTSGFTPGTGNILTGQTAITLSDSGLLPSTTYYYKIIATDTGNSNATVTSSQLLVGTQPALSQNQFAQQVVAGLIDLTIGSTNIIAAQVDSSVTTVIYPGQAVKIVANTAGGVPRVAPIASKSDQIFGFTRFNIKDIQYAGSGNPTVFVSAGQMLEVAMFGTVIWLYATGAITQFAEVCVDPTFIGGVQATGNTATYIGWAIDGTAAAGLIRVMILPNISYATA